MKWTKAAVMFGLIVIQLPVAIASYVVSTVQEYKNFKQFHLTMLIIVRTSVLIIDGYMFALFGYLLRYYIRKHKQVINTELNQRSYIENKRSVQIEYEENVDRKRKCVVA